MGEAILAVAAVAGAVDVRTFNVLLFNMASVQASLEALAKRAVRKGLPVLTWTWGKAFTAKEHIPHPEYGWQVECKGDVSRIPCTITGCTPKFNGWTFVAALQHLDGENIVRALPGQTLPETYRKRGPVCDHCKHVRRRNDTYVVRHEDGRHMQVGSTCVADFLGSDDAGKLASAASLLAEARGLAEGGCEGMGSPNGDRLMADFLPFVAWDIRTTGWLSRTAARERGGQATADHAWALLTDAKARAKANAEPTEEDKALALAAEEWAESLTDATVNAERGDYLHNVRAVARTGLATYRTAGIAASMITAYQRAIGAERQKAARASAPKSDAFVGSIKELLSLNVTLDFVTGFDTDFGYKYVLKFKTAEGATLTWKTASDAGLSRSDVGKAYKLTGRVSKHELYKGEKQTIVQRCKAVAL